MTEYASNEFIAFYFHDARVSSDQLQRASAGIAQHTAYRVCDQWLSPRRKIGILNLSTQPEQASASAWSQLKTDWLSARPRTNRLRVREQLAILQTGYTTTPDRRFERGLREQGERLFCQDAGGIAAFCLARFGGDADERLFLWSTRPGLRAIASAEAPDMLVVGTRPRLVHALTRDFRAPSLDIGYVQASLVGWSLGERTPYADTTLLPVDALLRVCAGKRSWHPHPTPSYQREEHSLRRRQRLYRDALREAVEPLRALPFELRLSGGKDSRLVAAALFDRGITPSAVLCHGPEGAPEPNMAQRAAHALGWPLQRLQPKFAYRGSLFESVRYNLSLADGFFASEPSHLAFPVHSLAGNVGPGVVIGHIELQKGGWASQRNDARERILEHCRQLMTLRRDALLPELTEAARRQVDAYADTLTLSDDADYGYWINYRFRVCRWLTSHYLSHSKEHLPVYPLVDEKVTRVVSGTPLWQLVSERLLAETTWNFAPALREVPLFGKPYRFIRQRHDRALLQRAPGAGIQAPPSPPPALEAAVRHASAAAPELPFMSERLAAEACAYIRAGKLREELRAVTQPQVWAVIEEPSQARMRASQLRVVFLNEFIWCCYQASLLHTDGLDAW